MHLRTHGFPETTETLISAMLSTEAKVREIALARFCTAYYPAFYGFARSLCFNEHDAQDRVQDFFVKVMREGLLQKFDPDRGSHLSAWLRVCFRNFVKSQAGGRGTIITVSSDTAEEGFQTAYLSVVSPEPIFDLLLARQIWRSARSRLVEQAMRRGTDKLVREILPFTLQTRWPEPPAASQEEVAAKHGTTVVRLKAYYNRTLKVQARREFDSEARAICAGINEDDLQHLWNLVCRYGEG
jgi:RNA polymerase sigma factor (sigma-70 family)